VLKKLKFKTFRATIECKIMTKFDRIRKKCYNNIVVSKGGTKNI
jgi:hypothetical protein